MVITMNQQYQSYHLVMTNIAMENPRTKWRFLAGKIIYFYGSLSMAMLNNQMVVDWFCWENMGTSGPETMVLTTHDRSFRC